MKLLRLLPLLLLAGCAGSGDGGSWTPEDTRAAIGIVDQGLNTYDHARAEYRGQQYVAPQPYP